MNFDLTYQISILKILTKGGEYDVIIVGGGLAGLTSSIRLRQKGHSVLLIEKNSYPFHKVCGEYVSNEVLPYLQSLGLDLTKIGAKEISKLRVTGINGLALHGELDLGAFGVSRYTLDFELYKIAQTIGVDFLLENEVVGIAFDQKNHFVKLKNGSSFLSKVLLGAYGKRTKLDKQLNRRFIQKRSPYVGVKYHIKMDSPQDLISLHNFNEGYCGMSAIEDDKYCLCYLSHRSNFDKYKSVKGVEEGELFKNPYLKETFTKATFIYDKPLVINEISFEKKSAIEDHMLMIGDTAGLITPLCGNGMAMAIHGGKLAADLATKFLNNEMDRESMEKNYQEQWKLAFQTRLWAGRNLQKVFGKNRMTNAVLGLLKNQPKVLSKIISLTHGEVVNP